MGTTNGTVEILMENDPEHHQIHSILLDINQIEIESVEITQVNTADGEGQPLEFSQSVLNGKLLDLQLLLSTEQKMATTLRVTVVIQFVSKITNTLQGIYKVDYKDDFGAKDE